MHDGTAERVSCAQHALGVERKSSKGVIGWIRHGSVRRLKSRDMSPAPRNIKDDDSAQKAAANQPTGQDSHSLAAQFKNVSHVGCAGSVEDKNYQKLNTFPVSQSAHLLSNTDLGFQSACNANVELSIRGMLSGPGDLSDASINLAEMPQGRWATDIVCYIYFLCRNGMRRGVFLCSYLCRGTSSLNQAMQLGIMRSKTRQTSRSGPLALQDSHELEASSRAASAAVEAGEAELSLHSNMELLTRTFMRQVQSRMETCSSTHLTRIRARLVRT